MEFYELLRTVQTVDLSSINTNPMSKSLNSGHHPTTFCLISCLMTFPTGYRPILCSLRSSHVVIVVFVVVWSLLSFSVLFLLLFSLFPFVFAVVAIVGFVFRFSFGRVLQLAECRLPAQTSCSEKHFGQIFTFLSRLLWFCVLDERLFACDYWSWN